MNLRRAAVATTVATLFLTPALAVTSSAQSSGMPYRVSAKTASTTVTAGHTFAVHGRYFYLGRKVDGGHVKVQAKTNGRWVDVKGARVVTNADGRYRVRLSLSKLGTRRLSVLAWQDNKQGVAIKNFTVTVVR